MKIPTIGNIGQAGGASAPLGKYKNEMKENKSHICTTCKYVGEPNISFGRLFIEFFANFLIGVGGVQLFQKVRHCPECGEHSMVLLATEAGQIALSERNENRESQTMQDQRGYLQAHSKNDDEYMRIRLQR